MNIRTLTRCMAVALCALVVLGCSSGGGDDDEAAAESSSADELSTPVERFCTAVEEVLLKGDALVKLKLDSDADVPDAKEKVYALIDSVIEFTETVPAEMSESAELIRQTAERSRAFVDATRTADEMTVELPKVANIIIEGFTSDGASRPLSDYFTDNCPHLADEELPSTTTEP